jgi:hypothetical protein
MHKDVYRNNERKLALDTLVVLLKIILKIYIREMWCLTDSG